MFTSMFRSFSDHESNFISIVTGAIGSNMFLFSLDLILMQYIDCICVCGLERTITTVELHSIGRQLDRNTTPAALGKPEILNLPICAQHVNIQNCREKCFKMLVHQVETEKK